MLVFLLPDFRNNRLDKNLRSREGKVNGRTLGLNLLTPISFFNITTLPLFPLILFSSIEGIDWLTRSNGDNVVVRLRSKIKIGTR